MRLKTEEDEEWLRDFDNYFYYLLYTSYLIARKGGKRKTFDEHKFEVNDFLNIYYLKEAILNYLYEPCRGTAHIIFNPVMREIFAAAFRDRVVHHFVVMMIYDWWDRHFIYDSYSCREGKGTKFGYERLQHHIRSVSNNNTEEVYVIMLDLSGYFMSLNRKKVYKVAKEGLDRQFKGNKGVMYMLLKFCLYKIIMDDPVKGVKKKGWPWDWKDLPDSKSLFKQIAGIGIVIGNLTSQLLSNIFLDKLDRYIKFTLGYKHYGRYVDDFYIVVPKRRLKQAVKDIDAIERYARVLGLKLHPKKRHVYPAKYGVAFLGAVVYPYAVHPGKRLIQNTRKAFYKHAQGARNEVTLISYVGHMKHMKHYRVLTRICKEVGLPGNYWRQFEK